MGRFEKTVREVLGEICSGKLLDEKTDAIMEAHCDIYALHFMAKMVSAQEHASEMSSLRKTADFKHYQGMERAFRNSFLDVAFDRIGAEDILPSKDVQEAIEFWQKKIGISTIQQ